MEYRRTGKKGVSTKTIQKAFYIQEPAAYIGGWPGFMNGVIIELERALDENGAKRPYSVKFGGEDGVLSPVWIEVFET